MIVDDRWHSPHNVGTNEGAVILGKLTALSVKGAKAGRHGDGAGLYLLAKPSGAKSWLLRIQQDGRRRDIGLGSIAALSLAEARERAAELRKHVLNGRDPIVERDRHKRLTPTFKEASKLAHAALESGWIDKNAAAFLTSLEKYAWPKIGNITVDAITATHVRDVLFPIWTAKPELARKVRMRVGQVLNFAFSKGWRAIEAPGRAITLGLPKQPKGSNFKAMPYHEVPAFFKSLREGAPTTGRRGLMLQILTAARPGEIRFAKWGMIDIAKCNWDRPAELMKEREPHTVTLNRPALDLLSEIKSESLRRPDELILPGQRGRVMSDMTMNKILRDMDVPYVAHAFRSSFRDWAAECMSAIPDPVAEAALAHAVPSQVVRAYKRTKFIAMRRELLAAWGKFVVGENR